MKDSKEDIKPLDSNNKFHGYQEWYRANNKLWLRAKAKHGIRIGYEEHHFNKITKFNIT